MGVQSSGWGSHQPHLLFYMELITYITTKNTMEDKDLSQAWATLRALRHPLRLKIIDHLYKEEKENVTDLYIKFRMEQSVMSQHLRILKDAKVVDITKRGKFRYYSINEDRMQQIRKALDYLK